MRNDSQTGKLRAKYAVMSEDEKRTFSAHLLSLLLDSAERDLSEAHALLEATDAAWREGKPPPIERIRALLLAHGRSARWPE